LAEAALQSVGSFLTGMGSVTLKEARLVIGKSNLMTRLDVERRSTVLQALKSAEDVSFEPPDLDPFDDLTDDFLQALFSGSLQCGLLNDEVAALLKETAGYFRRTPAEAEQLLQTTLADAVAGRSAEGLQCDRLMSPVLRAILAELAAGESVAGVFDDVARVTDDQAVTLEGATLVGLTGGANIRSVVLDGSGRVVWRSGADTAAERVKRYVVDDCRLPGGKWSDGRAGSVLLSGSLISGGYSRTFRALLPS